MKFMKSKYYSTCEQKDKVLLTEKNKNVFPCEEEQLFREGGLPGHQGSHLPFPYNQKLGSTVSPSPSSEQGIPSGPWHW
ncbi:hypothetical protein G4V62_07425 [Bacillaceae bacterium SIJ1]|uniref:hypothetical protein n=1 Tax=Litoribacterium kuwaitense TaxID=1398745 RepID=UPI0013EC88E8|nr:hypothetical protein [Litoribacterium kuwaitense]NGP44795.1 hypothetical protein [Litoribacterium kuwaitense]